MTGIEIKENEWREVLKEFGDASMILHLGQIQRMCSTIVVLRCALLKAHQENEALEEKCRVLEKALKK